MDPASKSTGKTAAKKKRKRRSSITFKRKGKFTEYKKKKDVESTAKLKKKDIQAIKINLINSGLDSHELNSLTALLSAETPHWEEACKEKRIARVDGERNRRALDGVDLTETEDMTAKTADLTDDDGNDSDYDDILAQEDDEESVEEIQLDDDEEWVSQEAEHMYSTFASESDVFSTQSNKIGIAAFYLNVLSAPEEQMWGGREGTIINILTTFRIRGKGYYMWVKKILLDVRECILKNKEYKGQNLKLKRGPRTLLTFEDPEAEIVANTMEEGLGIRHAANRVNCYRLGKGKEILGVSCLFNLFQSLKPKYTTVGEMKTGWNDPGSMWATCRKKWVTQMIIMLGQYEKLDDLGLYPKNLPAYFDPTKLPKIKLHQIAWWDEHHIECLIAGLGGNHIQVRVPRDDNGKLSPSTGKS